MSDKKTEAAPMGRNAANLTGLPVSDVGMTDDIREGLPEEEPAAITEELVKEIEALTPEQRAKLASLYNEDLQSAAAPEPAPAGPALPEVDPNEPVYQAHHDSAQQELMAAFQASDANEILQAVYSKKLRVLRAGTEGAKRNTRAVILEQLAMGEIKDYQMRLRRELAELADRIFKLEAWLDRRQKEPPSDQENLVTYGFELSLCSSQLDAMRQYHSILSTRVMRDERYASHKISEMAAQAEANLKQQQADAGGVN